MERSARFCVECGSALAGGAPAAVMVTDSKGSKKAPPLPRTTGRMPVGPNEPRGPSAPNRPVAPSQEKAPYSRRSLQVDINPAAPASEAGSPMHEAFGRITGEPEPVTIPRNDPPAEADSALIGDILGDLDSTFEALLSEPGRVPQSDRPDAMREAQALFKQIAVAYIAPVRAFMLELRLGEASKDWVSVCTPAVSAMVASATQMGLTPLAGALTELKVSLDAAENAAGSAVDGKTRDDLLAKAEALMAELPEAFAIDEERERREPIILRSLLLQVSGVRKVQLDKIYRAGLVSLSMFAMASARELAEATGLGLELCQRIMERFARYREESLARPLDTEHSQELARLKEIASELAELNRQYDKDKRRVRQRRTELINDANVILARMGSVELVEKLERLPFQKKAEELGLFVDERRKL
jgi:Skp family chaperone for outer membrane proteins